jgi:hypothetical protein
MRRVLGVTALEFFTARGANSDHFLCPLDLAVMRVEGRPCRTEARVSLSQVGLYTVASACPRRTRCPSSTITRVTRPATSGVTTTRRYSFGWTTPGTRSGEGSAAPVTLATTMPARSIAAGASVMTVSPVWDGRD